MGVPIQIFSMQNKRTQKKKLWPKFAVFLILLIIISINAYGLNVGNKFYKIFFEANTNKGLDLYSQNKTYIDEKRYLSLRKEDVSVGSKNNYRLYGTYIKNPNPTKNTIILIHEFSGSRYTALKYLDIYIDKGFNVLIYDSRNHGRSGGTNITFGFSEKYDLDRWVTFISNKNKGGIIGVHGIDLGASAALLHSSLNEYSKQVSFYISDSSFSNLKQVLTLKLKETYKINNPLAVEFILFYTERVNKLNNQYTFKEASPINYVKDVTTPILFIHGENDTNIPKSMSEDLYNLKRTSKSIYIAPKAEHITSFQSNEEVYKDKVYKFIDSLAVQK